jgi:uncharacterized membrane protein
VSSDAIAIADASSGTIRSVILTLATPGAVAHAVCMVVAWLGLSPLATFIARYLKDYDPLWFKAHRLFQLVAVGLAVAGFILIQLENPAVLGTHGKLGFTVFGLALVQVLLGVFRNQISGKRHHNNESKHGVERKSFRSSGYNMHSSHLASSDMLAMTTQRRPSLSLHNSAGDSSTETEDASAVPDVDPSQEESEFAFVKGRTTQASARMSSFDASNRLPPITPQDSTAFLAPYDNANANVNMQGQGVADVPIGTLEQSVNQANEQRRRMFTLSGLDSLRRGASRPKQDKGPRRWLFNYLHWTVGRVLLVLSIVTIWYGLDLMEVSSEAKTALYVFVALYAVLTVAGHVLREMDVVRSVHAFLTVLTAVICAAAVAAVAFTVYDTPSERDV